MKNILFCLIFLTFIKYCFGKCYDVNYPFYKSKSFCTHNTSVTISKYYYPDEITLSSYYKQNPVNFNDVKNFVPEYKGSIIPNLKSNNTYIGYLNWTCNCFRSNTAKLIVESNNVNLTFISNNSSSYFCGDWYFIVTRSSYHIKYSFMKGTHTLLIYNLQDEEINDILNNGLRIFYFPDGLLGTLIDTYQVYRIFFGTYTSQNTRKFLEDNMNIKFIERPIKYYNFSEKLIKNGDLFIKTTLDGPNGLIMYGTGGRAGHMCVALWIETELYVLEATNTGIIKTPYKKWLSGLTPNNMYIMIAHLNDYYFNKFNATNAIKFFNSVEGLPYGYSNIFYSWVDTINDNYPTPLNEKLIPSLLVLTESLYSELVYDIFIKGINQRLSFYLNSTQCKNMTSVFQVLDSKNITLSRLLALPEKDIWTYPQGKQLVCSSFVMAIYKNAGLFDDILFEVTEFTPKDVYQLNIFNNTWTIPTECQVGNYKYCQIIGNHYWELPNFNSIKPYNNMNQRCGATPPLYKRFPDNC